jgi:hypothetical protein
MANKVRVHVVWRGQRGSRSPKSSRQRHWDALAGTARRRHGARSQRQVPHSPDLAPDLAQI